MSMTSEGLRIFHRTPTAQGGAMDEPPTGLSLLLLMMGAETKGVLRLNDLRCGGTHLHARDYTPLLKAGLMTKRVMQSRVKGEEPSSRLDLTEAGERVARECLRHLQNLCAKPEGAKS